MPMNLKIPAVRRGCSYNIHRQRSRQYTVNFLSTEIPSCKIILLVRECPWRFFFSPRDVVFNNITRTCKQLPKSIFQNVYIFAAYFYMKKMRRTMMIYWIIFTKKKKSSRLWSHIDNIGIRIVLARFKLRVITKYNNITLKPTEGYVHRGMQSVYWLIS